MKKVKILVEWVDKMQDTTLSASLTMEPDGQEVLLLLSMVLLVWAGSWKTPARGGGGRSPQAQNQPKVV
jgi:hypothetical protein